jgi:hypothetical protein
MMFRTQKTKTDDTAKRNLLRRENLSFTTIYNPKNNDKAITGM